jgi:hypothetical protein
LKIRATDAIERNLLKGALAGGAGVLLTACSLISGSKSIQDASSFVYEASYANTDIRGEADVSYTESSGNQTRKRVAIPWSSDDIQVTSGTRYVLTVDAPARDDTHLQCGIRTNNGWTSGPSMSGGHCSYTFPDDSGG